MDSWRCKTVEFKTSFRNKVIELAGGHEWEAENTDSIDSGFMSPLQTRESESRFASQDVVDEWNMPTSSSKD